MVMLNDLLAALFGPTTPLFQCRHEQVVSHIEEYEPPDWEQFHAQYPWAPKPLHYTGDTCAQCGAHLSVLRQDARRG